LNHPSNITNILRDDSNDKQTLIFESVATIQIGVYTAGEESDQHVIHMAPWVSRTTTIHKVPTRSKLELCSRNEVLAPNDRLTRPSSCCLILPPPNHLEAGREWFDKVVTGLLGLPSLINTTCGQSKSKLVHRGQNDMILNRHRWGLLPLNLRIATTLSPPFPFE
jgi:hypothetical protein